MRSDLLPRVAFYWEQTFTNRDPTWMDLRTDERMILSCVNMDEEGL